MVIPSHTRIRLWGNAGPGESILVTPSWENRTDTVVANRDGKWELWVQSPKAGGPYQITFIGDNTIVVDNILSGAVWLCSGQSNMEWNSYNGVANIRPEIEKHTQPQIRFFHVARKTARYPQEDVEGRWVVCDSTTLKSFSAVGYFFGSRLHQDLNMPVGLVNASWGGTPAEVWMPAELVHGNETWRQDAEKLFKHPGWTITPGYAYNAMIAPITPFVLDGVIWYQGESNVGAAGHYAGLFGSLIHSWRGQWNKDLPFYFVQIAPFTYNPQAQAALLREQQGLVASGVPNTGMVVISDLVDDTANIHPLNKKDVGHRLAVLALHHTYDRRQPGPGSLQYAGMLRSGRKLVLRFDGNDGTLVIKGGQPQTLLIAGADRVFLPARCRVAGKTLELWHPDIAQPEAVRYQFSNAGIGNIYDSYGLPLAPFRTDRWPLQ